MQSIKINENISINVIEMKKLKTTAVSVFIHRPLNYEEASYNALLPLVLKSASELCPSREEIARYLENLYGATMGAAVIKLGEDQVIYFDAETISDDFAPNGEKLVADTLKLIMASIFAPKIVNGAFDKVITEQEKINAADRIDSFVNDKRQYASTRCQQETARGTDFAILRFGDKEGLSKIDEKSLYEYYKKIITSSVIDIYICGSADIDEAVDVVRAYTDKLEFGEAELPKTEILRRNEGDINNVTESMDVAQGKLALGFLTNIEPGDEYSDALTVFNSVFGAGAHSKLFNNVREKLSLAYYASSMLEKQKGMLVVNAGIEFDNFRKAYDETLVQLEEIRSGNISEHEFVSSISSIVNTLNSYYDDQRAMAVYYLTEKIKGTNLSLDAYIENIKKVTPDEVAEVARKLQLDTVYFLKGKEEA